MRSLFKKVIVWVITLEARAVLRKYKPKIVAITGSVGKTSTKDAIFAVLAHGARVRKSEKSFNSEVGLPLTILGAPNAWGNPFRWLQNITDGLFLILFTTDYPEWLVLEVGADRPGDITSLSSWLRTDIVVITRLPEVPVHVEFFDSPEAVVEEKASLIDTLKRGGNLLLFADDERTARLEHRLPAPDAKILTFGFSAHADVRGEDVSLVRQSDGWPVGVSAKIVSGDIAMPVSVMGAVGAHAFVPALAAAAVGVALGKELSDMAGPLESYEPPAGRMRLLRGLRGTLIIDDTYNASPAATVAALETLALVAPKASPVDGLRPRGRRIAVLADMMELGRVSTQEHRKVGEQAAKYSDLLLAVGVRARDIAQGALEGGMKESAILQYEDGGRAGKELEALIKEGDCILIKGSQSMRMERVVEEVMAQPELAEKLLVRQDAEWKKR